MWRLNLKAQLGRIRHMGRKIKTWNASLNDAHLHSMETKKQSKIPTNITENNFIENLPKIEYFV